MDRLVAVEVEQDRGGRRPGDGELVNELHDPRRHVHGLADLGGRGNGEGRSARGGSRCRGRGVDRRRRDRQAQLRVVPGGERAGSQDVLGALEVLQIARSRCSPADEWQRHPRPVARMRADLGERDEHRARFAERAVGDSHRERPAAGRRHGSGRSGG